MNTAPVSDSLLRDILGSTRTIAAVGLSPNPIRPSHYVGRYLQLRGYRVIPVNPAHAGREILGVPASENLGAIPVAEGPVQMVDIFRRSEEAGAVVDEALEVLLPRGLRTIWMQIGVENPAAAARAEARGITVIMNRCPKIEHQRLFGELRRGGFNTGIISARLR